MENTTVPPELNSLDVLRGIRTRNPAPPEAGSEAEAQALARLQEFYSRLRPERVDELIAGAFATDVWFNDTLKTVRGRDELRRYLMDSAEAAEDCRVEFEEVTRTATGDHHLRWRMMIRFKRFARGRDTWSLGLSHVRFDADGRVVYQQDYWNAADGLYQHVPILGAAIRAIKRRL